MWRSAVQLCLGLLEERTEVGGLAQLARAPALHAGGQRFESVILHLKDVDALNRVLYMPRELFDIL